MSCLSNGKYQSRCENWLFIGVFDIKILFLCRKCVDVGSEYDLCGLFSVLRRSRVLRWQSVVAVLFLPPPRRLCFSQSLFVSLRISKITQKVMEGSF